MLFKSKVIACMSFFILQSCMTDDSGIDPATPEIQNDQLSVNTDTLPSDATETSTDVIESPSAGIETPTDATETPSDVTETSTDVTETSTGVTETSSDVIETPADGIEAISVVIETDPSDPVFSDWTAGMPYDARRTDAHWPVCSDEAGFASTDSPWSTDNNCVCSDAYNDSEEYDTNPAFPGYGVESTTGQTCIIKSVRSHDSVAVPVYVIGENNNLERAAFSRIELSDLYTDGNQWQCTEDTRDTLDGAFVSGQAAELTFGAGGDATFSITGTTVTGSWSLLHSGYATSTTRINIADQGNLLLTANPQLDGDQLVLYRSAFNRLSCQRINSEYPLNRFSIDAETLRAMRDSRDTLDLLNGDQLNGRTLQCAALEASYDTNRSGPGFISSTASDEELVVSIENSGFNTLQQVKTYTFGDYFGWFNEYGAGGGNFNSGFDALSVRRYSDDLSVISYNCCFFHGGAPSENSLWACRDIGGPSLCVDDDDDGFGWDGFGSCTP